MPRVTELTVPLLLARTVPEHDGADACLLWTGSMARGNEPRMRVNGVQVSVRRELYRVVHGRRAPRNLLVSARHDGQPCDGRCVHPDHVVARTHSVAHTGARMPPGHRLNSAQAKQATSKLSWDVVRAIRASTDTNVAWADRVGCSKQNISMIRAHKCWVDTAHPFAGLLAAAGQGVAS
jgi:hypothetical protein